MGPLGYLNVFHHNIINPRNANRRRFDNPFPTLALFILFLFIASFLYLLSLCATELPLPLTLDISSVKEDWFLKENWSLEDYSTENSMGDIHHSEVFFLLNYAAMMKDFKIFVYPGGNPTTCYHPKDKLKSKYASEHYFFRNLMDSRFLTDDPHKAHFFFIPISCQKRRGGEKVIETYVKGITFRYPHWNRTLGTDHFFVSCHDVGSRATEEVPFLLKNAIRLVCSPSYGSNYIPHKDVALPQILELSVPPTAKSRPFLLSSEKMQPPRTKLGFWAGSPNSDVRKNLRIFWKDVPGFDISIIDKRAERAAVLDAYEKEFYESKFCLCPRGETQVDDVCLAESMAFGCVPVILSDYYDLPFHDVFDWNKFSVILKEDDVPRLKQILEAIPEEKFEKMRQNVLQVKKHFNWHSPPVEYDEFHMVMYELWKRQHNVRH